MAVQQNFVSDDTIFVTGLPEDTTEDELKDFFGQIGIIKFDKKNNCPKIWIYKDKATGKGKGEATITYDDPPTATSAITWFDGKEFRGKTLTIQLAQRKSAPPQFSNRGGRGGRGGGYRNDGRGGGGDYDRGERGGFGGGGGGRPSGGGRPGDWLCPSCNNNNFAYRQECNRCQTQKPAGSEPPGPGSQFNNGGRYQDSRGGYSNRGTGSTYQHRDRDSDRNRDRRSDRNGDRHRDRGSDRERGGDRDRDRSRGYGGGGGSSDGPSRNHMRGRDDRRSRPY